MKLYGFNTVVERMRSNPQSIRQIYLVEGHKESAYIFRKANQLKIPIYKVPPSKMQKLARNLNSQGIMVDTSDFAYVPYDDLVEDAREKNRTIVFLDGLNDPQNLGAIIRSLACLADFSLVIPTHESVSVTEAVLRVASGGDNHIRIAKVSNLGQAIRQAKENDFFIVGAVVQGGENLMTFEFPRHVGLLIGSEQKGIRDVHKKLLDAPITIPMPIERLSFNVAHATTVFAYEITKQKKYRVKKSQ